MKRTPVYSMALVVVLFVTALRANVADMEDLSLAPASFDDGSDGAGGFISGGAMFNNAYDTNFSSWSGFAYSNVQDTTTPGFGNQYAAFTGGGAGGSENYAVAFVSAPPFGITPRVTFGAPATVSSAMITNTTYAAISMRDGDSFAKQFGGVNGTDPDYFKLTFIGLDTADNETGRVDFYLADYRDPDSASDYIVDTWESVDLSPLGMVSAVEFGLETTDVGQFGPNTPFYFALDNLEFRLVPEPAAHLSIWLLCCALLVRPSRRCMIAMQD